MLKIHKNKINLNVNLLFMKKNITGHQISFFFYQISLFGKLQGIKRKTTLVIKS